VDFFIIVAGGCGKRMGRKIPKQFIQLKGLPILMHTINNLHESIPQAEIILVLPEHNISMWKDLQRKFHFKVPVKITTGGNTRFDSVKKGLKLIPDNIDGLVGIHDGVRPFVCMHVVQNCFAMAQTKRAVIPVIHPFESVRLENTEASTSIFGRDKCYLVQTPQTFDIKLLKKAYLQNYRPEFTDDASVVESIGVKIHLVEGNRENIKLTTPFDLQIARTIIKSKVLKNV